jgi:aryl-alcohol dehydrogenase-like predicted oxidoreductase
MGWGEVDDDESVRAIHRALDLGINFFDTANNYGAGHSERVLGQALAGRRQHAIIATKFASMFDEETKTHFDNQTMEMSPQSLHETCEASLRRLNTDVIDLYQLHNGLYPLERAPELCDLLEQLVAAGKIRWYGWSTDDPERARVFAQGPHCTAIQHRLNIFVDAPEMLAVCDEFNLASVNRGPLGSGFLTGKYNADTIFPADDGRHGADLKTGPLAQRLQQMERLRPDLTRDGRTLTQAALGWIWARNERTIPIPGFKNVSQVEDNAGAARFGPLSPELMRTIDEALARPATA